LDIGQFELETKEGGSRSLLENDMVSIDMIARRRFNQFGDNSPHLTIGTGTDYDDAIINVKAWGPGLGVLHPVVFSVRFSFSDPHGYLAISLKAAVASVLSLKFLGFRSAAFSALSASLI